MCPCVDEKPISIFVQYPTDKEYQSDGGRRRLLAVGTCARNFGVIKHVTTNINAYKEIARPTDYLYDANPMNYLAEDANERTLIKIDKERRLRLKTPQHDGSTIHRRAAIV
ncbi:hypothetical protein Tcan_09043 [Toxocara canis]|uniref:Uncharacterized protein n=1 Tax=Toxocara canis TaxID=6265 RepID=A0A0B2VBX7_TOXCA|nr:hypothetical protein Tcan_09043 [Toxocara canis]